MFYVRENQFETNSSSMNQIIIHDPDGESIENKVIHINTDYPCDMGMMITDTETKAKILYSAIKELEIGDYQNHNEDTEVMMKNLITSLKLHGYEVYIDACYDTMDGGEIFGMEGNIGTLDKILTNIELLNKFLYDDKSAFYFGIENSDPEHNIAESDGYKIFEI